MLARLVHEAERRRRRGKGRLMTGTSAATKLHRTAFRTSRLLDFCSRKELIAQTGHQPDDWPLVVLKELIDNALDACEEGGTAPDSRCWPTRPDSKPTRLPHWLAVGIQRSAHR